MDVSYIAFLLTVSYYFLPSSTHSGLVKEVVSDKV
jgi:hypothetical protein